MRSIKNHSLVIPRTFFVALIAAVLILPLAAQTPRVSWVRQTGTSGFEQGNAVGYGEFGVYTAGYTDGSFQGQSNAGNKDAFVTLHDESGNLKWIRQFGSPAEDVATGVAGDGSGAYVVGYTYGVIQALAGGADSFIRKYDPNGGVLWTRQFGGLTDDFAWGVATHTSGVYVVGGINCCGGSLPGQVVPTAGTDGYIRKYSGDGNELWTRMISTPDIDTAFGVAVDDTGVYVVGITWGNLVGPAGARDGFLRKYSHDGALLWTRQIGLRRPNGDFGVENVVAVAAGPAGVFIAGSTAGGVPPGGTFAGGLWDAFIVKFDANGNEQWYRQIGTDGDDYAYTIALGPGHVLVGGGVGSDLVNGAFVGGEDAFLRMYDFDGNVLGTMQFGNGLNDSVRGVVAFPGGFFAGGTKNGDSLEQQPIGDNDVFLMRLAPPPNVATGGVLNAASFAPPPAPLAPGSIAVIFGANLNDGSFVTSPALDAAGKLVTSLGGTQVTVNGAAAPILYSLPSQVAIQIPFEVARQSTAQVVVTVDGQSSFPRTINIAPAAPGFFTRNQAGTGEAIAVHEDGVTFVTTQNPARRNEVITFYLTGLGILDPALGTGVPAAANVAVERVSTGFAAIDAVIEYAGAAPGFVGLNQINARVPANAPLRSDVPVAITVGGQVSNAVTIAIGPIPPGG